MKLNYNMIKQVADQIAKLNYKFRPYQIEAMKFCRDIANPYLAMDCGLGKTLVGITLAAGYETSTLVVAPKNVALYTWPEELEMCAPWLKTSVIAGPPTKRFKAVEAEADIHIISFSNLAWLCGQVKWKWDFVILDEISFLKSHKSLRYKAFRKVRKHCKKVIGMSATPAANNIGALYSQYYCLDMGETFGNTVTGFRDRYMVDKGRDHENWQPRPGAREEIIKKISPNMMRVRAKDHLKNLPKIQNVNHYFELSDRSAYQEMAKKYVVSEADILAGSAAVRSLKLRQLSSGFIYDKQRDTFIVGQDKRNAYKQLLLDIDAEQVMVFYQFEEEKRFINAPGLEEKAAWNAGTLPVICLHPQSAGHGLNMQHSSAHHIIWFSLPWSLEDFLQGLGRVARSGNKSDVVFSHTLLASATIESERVLKILQTRMLEHKELMCG